MDGVVILTAEDTPNRTWDSSVPGLHQSSDLIPGVPLVLSLDKPFCCADVKCCVSKRHGSPDPEPALDPSITECETQAFGAHADDGLDPDDAPTQPHNAPIVVEKDEVNPEVELFVQRPQATENSNTNGTDVEAAYVDEDVQYEATQQIVSDTEEEDNGGAEEGDAEGTRRQAEVCVLNKNGSIH